jgi:hypothetical protein
MPQVTLVNFRPLVTQFCSFVFLVRALLAPEGASNDQGHRKIGDMSTLFPPHLPPFLRGPETRGEAGCCINVQQGDAVRRVAALTRRGRDIRWVPAARGGESKHGNRPPQISGKNKDILKLEESLYLIQLLAVKTYGEWRYSSMHY